MGGLRNQGEPESIRRPCAANDQYQIAISNPRASYTGVLGSRSATAGGNTLGQTTASRTRRVCRSCRSRHGGRRSGASYSVAGRVHVAQAAEPVAQAQVAVGGRRRPVATIKFEEAQVRVHFVQEMADARVLPPCSRGPRGSCSRDGGSAGGCLRSRRWRPAESKGAQRHVDRDDFIAVEPLHRPLEAACDKPVPRAGQWCLTKHIPAFLASYDCGQSCSLCHLTIVSRDD